MGTGSLISRKKSLTARDALVFTIALLAIFAPVGALAMGHCPTMTSDCYGPCSTYMSVATTPPQIMAPPGVGNIVLAFLLSQPIAPFGTPDPPPRPQLSI